VFSSPAIHWTGEFFQDLSDDLAFPALMFPLRGLFFFDNFRVESPFQTVGLFYSYWKDARSFMDPRFSSAALIVSDSSSF